MSVIDHITLGVADADESAAFYDGALRPLGLDRLFDTTSKDSRSLGYGRGTPSFWIAQRSAVGGKVHVAFVAADRNAVNAFHREAIASGGKDNGAPDYRPYHPGYYAAFVLDPNGHNIEAVFHDAYQLEGYRP